MHISGIGPSFYTIDDYSLKNEWLFICMISFVCTVSESNSNDLVDINVFFSVCIYQIFFKTKQHKICYTNNCKDQRNNNQWYKYHVPLSIVGFPDHRTLCSVLAITCKKKNNTVVQCSCEIDYLRYFKVHNTMVEILW